MGCEVVVDDNVRSINPNHSLHIGEYPDGMDELGFPIIKNPGTNLKLFENGWVMQDEVSEYENLGHPLELRHVLMALENVYTIESNGYKTCVVNMDGVLSVVSWGEGEPVKFHNSVQLDLSKPMSEQATEVYDKLLELLT
jgi:hypothetical protein